MARGKAIREGQPFPQPLWMQLLPAILLGGRPQLLCSPLFQNKRLKVPLDATVPQNTRVGARPPKPWRRRGGARMVESQPYGIFPACPFSSSTRHSSLATHPCSSISIRMNACATTRRVGVPVAQPLLAVRLSWIAHDQNHRRLLRRLRLRIQTVDSLGLCLRKGEFAASRGGPDTRRGVSGCKRRTGRSACATTRHKWPFGASRGAVYS